MGSRGRLTKKTKTIRRGLAMLRCPRSNLRQSAKSALGLSGSSRSGCHTSTGCAQLNAPVMRRRSPAPTAASPAASRRRSTCFGSSSGAGSSFPSARPHELRRRRSASGRPQCAGDLRGWRRPPAATPRVPLPSSGAARRARAPSPGSRASTPPRTPCAPTTDFVGHVEPRVWRELRQRRDGRRRVTLRRVRCRRPLIS